MPHKEETMSTMSKWMVSSNYFNGSRHYQVYRLINVFAVDHSGNREYRGEVFSDKASAQALADKLNAEEERHE